MPFNGMIKLKLKCFKSMQNKITKKVSILYFLHFRTFFKKKRKKDYTTQKHFKSEKKGKRGKRKREEERGKSEKEID